MGQEVNLLANYPKTSRDLSGRLKAKSTEVREAARRFDELYFDGPRIFGYGGFRYDERFWKPVIPELIRHFELTADSSFLDVGCAKGFMLHDLRQAVPGINICGIDISEYAIAHAMPTVVDSLLVGNAASLPFDDNSFDAVISINTIHNLNREQCGVALQEIQRVSKGRAFVTVDAYRNEIERERMEAWNLTALTMMSTAEWEDFFEQVGYTGDYYWFTP